MTVMDLSPRLRVAIGIGIVILAVTYALWNWERLEVFKMLLSSFFPLGLLILAVLGSIVLIAGLANIAIAIANPIDHRETVVALMEPGDLLGEMAMLDGGPRTASAIASDGRVSRRCPPVGPLNVSATLGTTAPLGSVLDLYPIGEVGENGKLAAFHEKDGLSSDSIRSLHVAESEVEQAIERALEQTDRLERAERDALAEQAFDDAAAAAGRARRADRRRSGQVRAADRGGAGAGRGAGPARRPPPGRPAAARSGCAASGRRRKAAAP